MPRVAHIFALAGVLCVSASVSRAESIPPHGSDSLPGSSREKKLVIFLTSDSPMTSAAFLELKKEVGTLMQPASIRVDWRNPAVDRDAVENDYFAVIRLRGSCRPAEVSTNFERATKGGFTLASSAVADGVILPFGDIDCAALNSFLGPSLLNEPDRVREFVYARAMARLMAHELYHVIGQTHEHARSGLAEPAFTVAELLSDRFEFANATLSQLHASPDPHPQAAEYSARVESDDAAGR